MWLLALSTFMVAMAVTWVATPRVIRLARAVGALDHPGERKVHFEPIPRIGGVAVLAGFAAAMVFAALLTGKLVPESGVEVHWRGFALATVALVLLGVLDDLGKLAFAWKLAGQVAAAVFVWQCGFSIEIFSNPLAAPETPMQLGWLSLPLTVLWIVGITNAVNLIDGLDGLAAGVALISTIVVGVIAGYRGFLGVTAASVALAGSLTGFLRFNFNPARIFLGDSGSMLLGFVLAVTAVRGSQKSATLVAILAPLLVLGLPILETSLTVARRLYRLGYGGSGDRRRLAYVLRNTHHVFLPDREHTHHRLLDLGLSHRAAVLTLYAVASLLGVGALGVVFLRNQAVALLLVGLLVMSLGGLWLILRFLERRQRSRLSAGAATSGSGKVATAGLDRR